MRLLIVISVFFLPSCFLARDHRKRSFTYTEEGATNKVGIIVPKKYERVERKVDTLGIEAQIYYYPDGAVLYFAKLKDSSLLYQPIDHEKNIPRKLYNTTYYKGVDPAGRYWRETRFGAFKAGYISVLDEDDGIFDSTINYFSLRSIGIR